MTRVPSGLDGIVSATGGYHGIFEGDGSSAPFTRFGGYEDTWSGEWTTSVSIYLDATNDGGGLADGEGFDYSSAASGSDGNHQRDFIFHVTQDTSSGDLLINASNNTNFAPREDLDTLSGTATITEDGWYRFEHRFYEVNGHLAVDMTVYDEDGAFVFEKTLENVADTIPAEVGGNRYGWFTTIDVADGIAVDDTALSYAEDQTVPLPSADDIFFV